MRLVLFPKPIAKCLVELPEWKLRRVEEYIRERVSPFAQVVAIKPIYEFITIRLSAMLQCGSEESGEVVKRIRRKIFSFFASWYLNGEHPSLGKEYWHSSLLSRVTNDEAIFRTIVLKVKGAMKVSLGDDHHYRGTTQCSLLIPRHIDIELVEYNTGIGDAVIVENFVID